MYTIKRDHRNNAYKYEGPKSKESHQPFKFFLKDGRTMLLKSAVFNQKGFTSLGSLDYKKVEYPHKKVLNQETKSTSQAFIESDRRTMYL